VEGGGEVATFAEKVNCKIFSSINEHCTHGFQNKTEIGKGHGDLKKHTVSSVRLCDLNCQ